MREVCLGFRAQRFVLDVHLLQELDGSGLAVLTMLMCSPLKRSSVDLTCIREHV